MLHDHKGRLFPELEGEKLPPLPVQDTSYTQHEIVQNSQTIVLRDPNNDTIELGQHRYIIVVLRSLIEYRPEYYRPFRFLKQYTTGVWRMA